MKFIYCFLSFLNSKRFLFLFLLINNCFIESNQRITMGKIMRNRALKIEMNKRETLRKVAFGNKTFRYTMSAKAKLVFRIKLKLLLVGFFSNILINIMKKVLDSDSIEKIVVPTVDFCYDDAYNHYEKLIAHTQKKLNCDPQMPFKTIPNDWKIDIQGICSKKKTIDQLDDEQFSTSSIILGYIKNVFTDNSKFIEDYKKFKADYGEMKDKINAMNKDYLIKFKTLKDKYQDGTPEKNFLNWAIGEIDAIFISKNICEILEYCQDLTLWQRLQIIGNSAFYFVKCIPQALSRNAKHEFIIIPIKDALAKIGYDALLNTLLSGVLPTPLLGILFTLVTKGWGILNKMVSMSWTYQPDQSAYDNQEKDLYLSIGSLLGGLFSQLIGITSIKDTLTDASGDIFSKEQGTLLDRLISKRRKFRN